MVQHGYVSGYGGTEEYNDISKVWTLKTNVTTDRSSYSGFALNNNGFAIGGYNGVSMESTVERYTPDVWVTDSYLRSPRWKSTSFILNNYGYDVTGAITTGGSPVTTMERYDYIGKAWSVSIPIQIPKSLSISFSINNYGYLTSGESAFGVLKPETEKYDDINKVWSILPNGNIITPAYGRGCFILNNTTPYINSGNPSQPTNATEKFDTASESWSSSVSSGLAKTNVTGFTLNNNGYIAGGIVLGGAVTDNVQKFDGTSWSVVSPLTQPRTNLSSFVLDDDIIPCLPIICSLSIS